MRCDWASASAAPKNPVPGRDVAGTVAEIGSAVTRFAVGDEVYGVAAGSFAEYAVGKEAKLARKPANLTFAQAAVVPVSGATALRAVQDVGRLEAGQSVLVLGASGGVGSYAVQIANAFGAEVTGVCSPAKIEFVSSLGADHVIDYTQQRLRRRHPPVRPHPRHRREPIAAAIAASPQTTGDRRVRRR